MEEVICRKCKSDKFKKGKIAGISAVQSLKAKTGLSGSSLIVTFCEECGTVSELTVENPKNIK